MGDRRKSWTVAGYVVAAVAAVAIVVLGVVAVVCDWRADAWAALGTWATAAVALVAGMVALGQLGEARRLRAAQAREADQLRAEQARLAAEQAQPYVVAFMDSSAGGSWMVELVLRNFGTTAAHDVGITIEPTAQRKARGAQDGLEPVLLPERIPVLAPGQEWRTFWDVDFQRRDSGLPDRHEAVVTFSDSQGRPLPPLPSVLDWSPYWQRHEVVVYGAHHSAEALRQISKTLKKWQETPGDGLAVFVRDGDPRTNGSSSAGRLGEPPGPAKATARRSNERDRRSR